MKDFKQIQIDLYGGIQSLNGFIYYDKPCTIEIIPELYFGCRPALQRKIANIANEIYFKQFTIQEYLYYIIGRLAYDKARSLLDDISLLTMEQFLKDCYDKRTIDAELAMIDHIITERDTSLRKLFMVDISGTSLLYDMIIDCEISPMTYLILLEKLNPKDRIVGFTPRNSRYKFFHEKIIKSLIEVQNYYGSYY